jgi:alkanesulfonate monooxygenase SsuD/methylene tetrahydromethanopterin reductase-like flavin-dependent oxidoreductase (luciferase family)
MPRFGMITFATEYSMEPAAVARAIEERGLDAFYVSEHTHIPTSRKSKYPGGTDYHKDFYYDPIVALTAAASVTSRIKLGTFIILIAQRDPIVTAKQFATLDHLSGVGSWSAAARVGMRRKWPITVFRSNGAGPRFASISSQ